MKLANVTVIREDPSSPHNVFWEEAEEKTGGTVVAQVAFMTGWSNEFTTPILNALRRKILWNQ